MSRDTRIDAYIDRQAEFARPILNYIRDAVHAAGEEVEESVKWGMPAFLYKGRPLANMAAFKAHAVMGFWQGQQLREGEERNGAMGEFGRITKVDDLPERETLIGLVRKAMKLIDEGVKPVRNKTVKEPIAMPDDLREALAASPAAQSSYDGFPPSAQREYLEWVVEAKRPETRAKRVAQAVEWMAAGKRRNWKYEAC
jgi:uncharacterized protein YdeI (YjbR/CyaY-like superfamily)